MKNILVTGGSGFIGSNFIHYMLGTYADIRIVNVDALTYAGNPENLIEVQDDPRYAFVHADVADAAKMAAVFADYDVDTVIHFAAESHVDRSIADPDVFARTNVMGTLNLLNCARAAWQIGDDTYRDGVRYVQVSTDEVYGSLGAEGFFTETTPLCPHSPYSASKASADLFVKAYADTFKLPVCITRCSNNYGPYQFPEKLIPLVIKNILEGRKLPVYGKGENVRDWLYVDDHCKGIDMVLRRGRLGEVYNIGGFNEQENITIVKSIISLVRKLMQENPAYRSLLKIPVEDINEELITYVADRPGHDMRYAIDPEKIATELGWYPETSFPVGIEKTVRWYLDNPDWVESVTSGAYLEYYHQMYDNRG